MKMYANAWKKDGNIYTVQVNEIKQGDKTELKKIFKDWNESGIGWNVKNGDQLILFSKPFEDQKEWLSWAKKCPINLVEIRYRSGKEQKVQLTGKKKRDK